MDRVRVWAAGLCVVFFAPLLNAQDVGPSSLFENSQLVLSGAATADVVTSFTSPGYEANPLLDRNFGAKDASIVLEWTAALIIGEHFAIKRWPKTRKAFAWINFGAAAPHAYAAIHNR